MHSATSALGALVTLTLMTVTLLVVQLASGEGIRLTALILPVAFVLLALAVAGAGLIVGALAAVYVDALEMTRIVLTLAGFLTPAFYPVSIVPGRWRYAIEANPISVFLKLFRQLAYGGDLASWWTLPACAGIAVFSLTAGVLVFARVRRALPTVL